MKLLATDWSTLLGLLDTVLQLPAAERQAWVDALPDVSADVRDKLRELLRERDALETNDFLTALPPLPSRPPQADHVAGDVVGPYRLLRPIGSGGMGAVWLAERLDAAIERQIALKLPHRGLNQSLLAGRLEQERRILAALEHQHIARLYDAGVSADGWPFMALEYVDGQPLGDWCDARQLGIAERLQLFLQVLDAVQYAHAKLVLHRDLKPANVLVNREGQVKLLDFGIAKLMTEDSGAGGATAEPSALTEIGGSALTPDYAAPEQIGGEPLGTACDIYALGVLLYELLTGCRPYRLPKGSRGELERAIALADITRPSVVVQSGGDAQTRAAARATRPQRLAKALRGDLDVIVLKALRQAPAERYATAQAFAQDIERSLRREPIAARPDSTWYRVRKLVVRNRIATAASALAVLALFAGTGIALWQAQKARVEAQRSQLAYNFVAGLFAQNDPQQARGRQLTGRDMLNAGAAKLDAEFAEQPEALADLHLRVGKIYHAMSDYGAARLHVDRAEALFKGLGRAANEPHLDALLEQATLWQDTNEFDAMARVAQGGLDLAQRTAGPGNRWEPSFLQLLAAAQLRQGNPDVAEKLLLSALDKQRKLQGERSALWLQVAADLAVVYAQSNRLPQALAMYNKVIDVGGKTPAYEITDLLIARYSRAIAYGKMGDTPAAERDLREVVPMLDQHLGPRADRTVLARAIWGRALAELGRYAEALQTTRTNLSNLEGAHVDEENRQIARTYAAVVLRMAGHLQEALPLALDSVQFFDKSKSVFWLTNSKLTAGDILLADGKVDAALGYLRKSNEEAGRYKGVQKERVMAVPMVSLGLAQRASGATTEAQSTLRSACVGFELMFGDAKPPSLRCRALLAWTAADLAQGADRPAAIAAFAAARAAVERAFPAGHPLAAELLEAEASLRDAAGDRQTAAPQHRAAQAAYRAALGAELPARLTMLH